MAKPRTERSLLFPSKEFRDRVRQASKDRGFRSEQAFILAACESEMCKGENTEATAQFEARVAATLTNLAKQIQGLQTLAHAQVALIDVFLKYIITLCGRTPGGCAARVRARLRYENSPAAPKCGWPGPSTPKMNKRGNATCWSKAGRESAFDLSHERHRGGP